MGNKRNFISDFLRSSMKKGKPISNKNDLICFSKNDPRDLLRPSREDLSRQIEEKVQELHILRERYQTLFESVSDIIFTLDEDGYFIEINGKAESLGKPRDQIIGRHFTEFLTSQSRETASRYFGKAKKGNRVPYNYEVEIQKSDGTTAFLELHMLTKYNGDQFAGRFGVAQDITERKRTEERMREIEKRYYLLTENVTDIIWIMDMNLRMTYVSPSIKNVLGYTVEEMFSQTLEEILLFPSFKEAIQVLGEELVLEKKEGQNLSRARTLELEALNKNGSTVWTESMISFLRDSKDLPIGMLGVTRDISERKRAGDEMEMLQKQLQQSQKMEAVGQLAGGIAHDFNNLLTIIRGNAQLSLLELHEGDPLRENLQEIQQASAKAADLIRQLLAFSRRQIMEMKIFDLNALLRDLDKMLRRVISEDIELATILEENLGAIKIDPGQIEQVIMNLAVNARDAMPSGGKLTIMTTNMEFDKNSARTHMGINPGRYVMFLVKDTGVGMIPEIRDRIFEPFFTTKEKGKGTGLGLSTVYGIVKQSGGTIWVETEPEQGTTFNICLPRVDEPVTAVEEKGGEAIPRGHETILVVEDEEEVRKLAVRILQKHGYHVLEAPQGNDALLAGEQHQGPIHLMLTDVVLPGLNGYELARRLGLLHPEMKILYMSGYAGDPVVRRGILEEGLGYLPKPFSIEDLAYKVRKILDS